MTAGVRGPELVQPRIVLTRRTRKTGISARSGPGDPERIHFPQILISWSDKRHAKRRLKSCQIDVSDSPADVRDLTTWHKVLSETLPVVLRISARNVFGAHLFPPLSSSNIGGESRSQMNIL